MPRINCDQCLLAGGLKTLVNPRDYHSVFSLFFFLKNLSLRYLLSQKKKKEKKNLRHLAIYIIYFYLALGKIVNY